MRLVAAATIFLTLSSAFAGAQVRLKDESDRAALRAWFVLLADSQFERPTEDVTDCAALVRFAFREALRPHTDDWARRVKLPGTPSFPDVKSAPRADAQGWALFRVPGPGQPRHAEFADARTIVSLNSVAVGRDVAALQPGDLLYFSQPEQKQPDHLMVFVGRSVFERDGADWVVYHTGPLDGGPGEVRKVRLRDLREHPSPRWRPLASNQRFAGIFRLLALA